MNDLLNADNNLKAEELPFDTVCFHCQQAAEKLLKAYLVGNERPTVRYIEVGIPLNLAPTALLSKDGDLFFLGIHVFTLLVFPGGERFRKGAVVLVSSSGELSNKGIMPYIQGLESSLPPDDFRVSGISPFPLREYCPYRMEFPMLTEEMIPA